MTLWQYLLYAVAVHLESSLDCIVLRVDVQFAFKLLELLRPVRNLKRLVGVKGVEVPVVHVPVFVSVLDILSLINVLPPPEQVVVG